jgi:hypothetical protein
MNTTALSRHAFFAFACLAIACSSADDASQPTTSSTVKVKVPAIQGDVPRDQFCKVYKEVHCAANVGCCARADLKADTIAECVASTDCPAVLDSPLVTGGTIRYDAKAAGDFLRAQASVASNCGAVESMTRLPFLAGTRKLGEDCSPQTGDTANASAWVCETGLTCELTTDDKEVTTGKCVAKPAGPALQPIGAACEDGSSCQSSRCAASKCAARLEDGAKCLSGDDCASLRCGNGSEDPSCADGSCKCESSGDAWCAKPLEPAPANADWSSPTSLCVYAHSGDGYGTSASLTVRYLQQNVWYGCTLASGIKDGGSACCTPSKITSSFANGGEKGKLYVQNKTGDGLRVTRVRVYKGTSYLDRGTFTDSVNIQAVGCTFTWDCESFWIDADGHDDCKNAQVDMSDGSLVCSSYAW